MNETIRMTITEADLDAYAHAQANSVRAVLDHPRLRRFARYALSGLIAFTTFAFLSTADSRRVPWWVVALVAVCVVGTVTFARSHRSAWIRAVNGHRKALIGPIEVQFLDNEIVWHAELYESRWRWTAMQALRRSEIGIELVLEDPILVYRLPKRAFASEADELTFFRQIEAYRLSAKAEAARAANLPFGGANESEAAMPRPLAATDSEAGSRVFDADVSVGFIRDFTKSLSSGLRCALLIPPSLSEFPTRWDLIPLLLAITLVLRGLIQWVQVGIDAQFSAYALPAAVFYIGPVLMAAIVYVSIVSTRDRLSACFIALIATYFWINAIALLAFPLLSRTVASSHSWFLYLSADQFSGLWLAVAFVRLSGRFLTASRARWAISVGAALLFAFIPLTAVNMLDSFESELWTSRPDPDLANAYRNNASEQTLYGENALLHEKLAALEPRVPGKINLFFVGFAGTAWQDVFMREIDSVGAQFDRDFGTRGHSIRLINNSKTVGSVPMASGTALRTTLDHIGSLMDPAQDILVLYMTSHGSEETGVSVSMYPFQFADVNPKELLQMLDEANIKRRVIIISACHSGIFIAPLKNADTLVMTASKAENVSFGCSNEADYTYFGDAYFARSLVPGVSFQAAFRKAVPLIEAREDADKFVHSEPQMALGDNIEHALATWQSQQPAYKN